MKKLILVAFAVVIGFLALSFENPKNEYPNYLPEELITFFKSEYLTTIENESLNSLLEKNFPSLFDKVALVHAQQNVNGEFYFLVFAEKNNQEIFQLLKINESDIANKTYSYIDFSGINQNSDTVYCKSGNDDATNPIVCPSACEYYTNGCLGMVCGVYQGGQCIQQ